jgi:hypothetical protein
MKRVFLAIFLAGISAATTIWAQNVGKPTPPPPLTNPAARTVTTAPAYVPKPGEVVVNFPNADIGHPAEKFEVKGLTFTLWQPLQRSQAVPRVMFFPHLETEKNGILNAMSNEQQIPVKIAFPEPVSEVTLVLFGSISVPALVEARDKDDKLLDSASLAAAPNRKSPADPIPSFELTVKGENIAYVLFGGARTGEFIAAEEIRYMPAKLKSATVPAPAK